MEPSPFLSLPYDSLIRNRYPFTVGLTGISSRRMAKPGFELTTFRRLSAPQPIALTTRQCAPLNKKLQKGNNIAHYKLASPPKECLPYLFHVFRNILTQFLRQLCYIFIINCTWFFDKNAMKNNLQNQRQIIYFLMASKNIDSDHV